MPTILHHHRTSFDDWRSIFVSVYLTLIGYGVQVVMPVISAARMELLGFSEVEVGRVAGADLGGLAFGALLTALLMTRSDRRSLVVLGAVLVVIANLLCTAYPQYQPTLWLRAVAGTGSGICTAVAVASLGASSKPARAYNIMLFAFAFFQALEMRVLPMLSMNGIYWLFICGFVVGAIGTRWLPDRADEPTLDVELEVTAQNGHHLEHRQVPVYIPWLGLGTIFFTYVSIGGYWTYIELAADSSGVADGLMQGLLEWGSLASITGCLLATRISNRFGLARPLLMTLVSMAVAIGLLYNGIDAGKAVVSILSFNLLWTFVDIFQMSSVANADHSGVFAALIPGAQGLGQIVGPNIAASLLDASLGYDAVFLMCALSTLTGMAVYAAMYLRLRRMIPALADAS
ncbi:MFS transporter [Candidatus Methylobacter oryzae]|uniref:MFS transporter n=1 Tax=Candidatus Methylobacter oryzae TaxID=2497749 RepID=A0ABY3CFG7_9GAMM|nr:MFS transporter [Candidatus Methylobacter oryzae]TRW96995.1 MFS transporter [Candidatus Methylobacter oryzae]